MPQALLLTRLAPLLPAKAGRDRQVLRLPGASPASVQRLTRPRLYLPHLLQLTKPRQTLARPLSQLSVKPLLPLFLRLLMAQHLDRADLVQLRVGLRTRRSQDRQRLDRQALDQHQPALRIRRSQDRQHRQLRPKARSVRHLPRPKIRQWRDRLSQVRHLRPLRLRARLGQHRADRKIRLQRARQSQGRQSRGRSHQLCPRADSRQRLDLQVPPKPPVPRHPFLPRLHSSMAARVPLAQALVQVSVKAQGS